MDSHHERPKPDPHFERLHGLPLSYARAVQSFLEVHDPQLAPTMGFPAEVSEFSYPTLPNATDFTKGKAPAGDMLPPPTPGFPSGSQTPCESTCSIVNCDSGCNPSVLGSGACSLSQCNNLDQCMSEECCRDFVCLDHSLPTTRRESIDFSAEDQYTSSQQQPGNSGAMFSAYDHLAGFDDIDDDPVQCHWLLPDHECDITAPTNDALSQHVFNDHIQPETSLTCGWFDCDERINAQQLTDHLWSHHPEQHISDSYICLWNGCMEMFSDAEQLESHMEINHTQTESIDCRWGGCGASSTNSTDLQSHVNKEHLHLSIPPTFSSSYLETGLSDRGNSRRPKQPHFWSPEDDDLLMRVRAQNFTFKQIASQYFPDKSAVACQFRYAKIYDQQQGYDPQPTEQSTPLLIYSPLLPSAHGNSPYESHHPFVDPPLMQSSPALLLQRSSQLGLDHSPAASDHKCLWIIDDKTETICEARFGHPNELQAHIESTHYPFSEDRKRRPISVWVCKWMGCARKGQTRQTRDKLKKHIRTHTGCKSAFPILNFCKGSTCVVFSFSCRYCGKIFRENHKLANHERTHTNEKPYQCDLCEMAFASQDGLCKYKYACQVLNLLIDACSNSSSYSYR